MKCRAADCGAEILMARTINGRDMPVDPQPSDTGDLRLHERPLGGYLVERVTRLEADRLRAEGIGLHTAHFATCSQPNRFRRLR